MWPPHSSRLVHLKRFFDFFVFLLLFFFRNPLPGSSIPLKKRSQKVHTQLRRLKTLISFAVSALQMALCSCFFFFFPPSLQTVCVALKCKRLKSQGCLGEETPPPPPLCLNVNSHAEGLSATALEEKDYLI